MCTPMPNIALSSRAAATAAPMLFDSIPRAMHSCRLWIKTVAICGFSTFVASRSLWTRSIALLAIRRAVRLLTPSDSANLATTWLTECPCRIHPTALRIRILFSVWVVMATYRAVTDW